MLGALGFGENHLHQCALPPKLTQIFDTDTFSRSLGAKHGTERISGNNAKRTKEHLQRFAVFAQNTATTSCTTLVAPFLGRSPCDTSAPPRASRRFCPLRPRQKVMTYVLPAAREQVGAVAGGSGGQASSCRGAAFSVEEDLTIFRRVRSCFDQPADTSEPKRKCFQGVPPEGMSIYLTAGAPRERRGRDQEGDPRHKQRGEPPACDALILT
jgi:hypothetical protein